MLLACCYCNYFCSYWCLEAIFNTGVHLLDDELGSVAWQDLGLEVSCTVIQVSEMRVFSKKETSDVSLDRV